MGRAGVSQRGACMTAAASVGLSRIGQIAMTVEDVSSAVAFYRDVLGLRFLFEAPPSLAFFDCGGVRLMLAPVETSGPLAGKRLTPILYFAVDDIHEAARALDARGVAFEQRPRRIAELAHADLWLAAFRDMDGNILELMSEVPRA